MPRRNSNAGRTRAYDREYRLGAARLRHLTREVGEGASEKQETPAVGATEVSTAHHRLDTEVRAASAQSDTYSPR